MARRTYDQYCGLAHALDLVGERWTLLIVRDLMPGPQRYSDLVDGLRGIGTSLLASRLRQLEGEGLIERRRLAPPIASTVYELTPAGRELAEAMMPLALWGVRHAVPEAPTDARRVRAQWALLALTRLVDPAALAGLDATFRVEYADDAALLVVRDGQPEIRPGTADLPADVTIRTDPATLAAIGAGRLGFADAAADGRLEIDGDADALGVLVDALSAAVGAR